MYVSLARTKTDFTIPFNLTPYKGKNVVLDIVTKQTRNSVRDAKDDVCWDCITLGDTFDTTNTELQWCLAYHPSLTASELFLAEVLPLILKTPKVSEKMLS